MTTNEDHPELAVPDLVFQEKLVYGRRKFLAGLHQVLVPGTDLPEPTLPSQIIDGPVPGHAVQPGGRVFGQVTISPGGHGLEQRILYNILGNIHMLQTQQAG
jgi:hypothetical protein